MRPWLALVCASLAAAPADDLPPASRVAERESTLATVASESRDGMFYVGAHVDALEVYLRNAAGVGLPPGRKPRIEVADVAGLADDVACLVQGGHVLVTVRLGGADVAPLRAGEAAARAWLAAEVLAGRGGPAESLLLARALRRSFSASEFAAVLAGAGRGEPIEPVLARFATNPGLWWLATRQSLIDARPPLCLGVRESLAELDDLARFVHDPVGLGDVVLTGPQAARLSHLPALREAMAARLLRLRRDILRQNPVAHNAWRSLGAWLEAYPTASETELGRLWQTYIDDRAAASRLADEVERALGSAR